MLAPHLPSASVHLWGDLLPDKFCKVQPGETPLFYMHKWEGCGSVRFYNLHVLYFNSENVTKINVCIK